MAGFELVGDSSFIRGYCSLHVNNFKVLTMVVKWFQHLFCAQVTALDSDKSNCECLRVEGLFNDEIDGARDLISCLEPNLVVVQVDVNGPSRVNLKRLVPDGPRELLRRAQ